MSTDMEQLESLREVSPQASLHSDGGITCVLLPATHLVTPGGMILMDTVLCPSAFSGYATRLLLERQIAGKSLNWQNVTLLGRAWQTWSWNLVPADQPWIRIFAEHARVLRP